MNKKKKAFGPKDLFRILILILCGMIIGINVYSANSSSLMRDNMPMPFGYGAAVVLSGSMEPELSTGDLIIVEESKEFSEKDIVVFQSNGMLIVHRVVSIDGDTLITKGDANNVEDPPVKVEHVKGKVLFWIPLVGYVVNILKTPIGTIAILALAFVLIEIPTRREREKDDEERQKIIDEINRLKKEI